MIIEFSKFTNLHDDIEWYFLFSSQQGFEDCVPRADVIFIQYDSEPEDTWAIDQIDVDIRFPLGPLDDDWCVINITTNKCESMKWCLHEWHFEHAVLLPCASWMREAKLYQIGPRNGLFITHNYRHQPKPGDWIRDWV
uniref:PLAT domain-containing protein n=1 Tax=Heterorhabditis bacteriophora TaxID=37862 RepID=A0A1I7X2E8_HETBA